MKSGRDWSAFDRPEIRSGFGSAAGDGCSVLLALDGIHCANCATRAERLLAGRAESVRVNLAARTVSFSFRPETTRLSSLLQALDDDGLDPRVLASDEPAARQVRARRLAFARIGVSTICAMQVMMLAWPSYFGVHPEPAIAQLLRWAQFIMACPGVLWAGWPLFRGAWQALRAGQADMNVPVALALGVAFGASAWRTVSGSGDLYFDTATMFVWFLAVGRYLEGRTRALAAEHLRVLGGRRSLTAQRRRNGVVEEVSIGTLQAGDEVVVAPGDTLPADGELLHAAAELDESLLTGESRPVPHLPGQALMAGAINVGDAPLSLSVRQVGAATLLAQITRLLDQAQSYKPKLQLLADRLAAHFIAAVLLFAACAFAWTLWRGGGTDAALNVLLAVLVASCPCALSLAVPAAFAAATSALARSGVLVANPGVLQALTSIDTVLFDKTGTLTEARMQLKQVVPLSGLDAASCTRIAAALEQGGRHPIALALAAAAAGDAADQVRHEAGRGVSGMVAGQRYWLGAPEYAPFPASSPLANGLATGDTAVLLCDAARPLAWFVLGSTTRPEVSRLIGELQQRGLAVELLSGDTGETVEALARSLGIERHAARQSSAGKLERLRQLQRQGARVLAVGDGLNDAPLLAAADASAAMPQGAALTQTHADLLLTGDSLAPLPMALDIARAARRRVGENLIWALGYNLLVLPLAMTGHLQPWAAAAGMSVSSLLVVGNALRLSPARRPAPALTLQRTAEVA